MLKIDLHLHTIASGHAHNTILEYINQAKKRKMKIIGFAEHGPSMEDVSNDNTYFLTLDRIPKVIQGVRILKGIEANIVNEKGELDIPDDIIARKLDYVIANFHKRTGYNDLGKDKNTAVMIRAINSGKIDIISHPFKIESFDSDIEKISEAACKKNVLLEVNLHYLSPQKVNDDTINRLKIMIDIAKQNKQKVIVNSDAHNIWEMGDDSELKKIKKEIGLTEKMIINNYPKELMQLLRIKE